jgi:AcrR family transcriptional regulator
VARALHDEESLLDSARSVVLGRGLRGATVAAVAEASRAPTGSIYHRFASVDELLARAWIRAARRSQACALVPRSADPVADVVAAALAMYDFCLRERDDALLLASVRRADFAGARLPGDVRDELERVNRPLAEPLRELTRRAFGRADRRAIDLVLLAILDLPYGFARRHLEAGTTPPARHRRRLEAAVLAAIDEDGSAP